MFSRDKDSESTFLSKSLYISLQITGRVLSKSTEFGNRIAERIEPVALKTISKVSIPNVKAYLKPIPDPRLRIESPVSARHRKKSLYVTSDSNGDEELPNQSQRPADEKLAFDDDKETPKHLYQIRNEVFAIAAMAMYSIPYTAKFFDYLTPASKKKTAVDSNDLKSFHIYSSGAVSENLCFSFAGSSWLFFYEMGVAIALQECIQARALHECFFMGVSTGSFVAACLSLEIPLERIRAFLVSSICAMSRQFFGPIGQCSKMWADILDGVLLDDVELANDRLFISLTKLPSMENQIQSKFTSKKDLKDHILASCYMPILFETPVKIGSDLYINGSYQNHISTLENVLTITCSPNAGEANICPSIMRYTTINKTFPPNESSVCQGMIEDGFKDAKKWLSRMLISQTLPERFFQPDFKHKFLSSSSTI